MRKRQEFDLKQRVTQTLRSELEGVRRLKGCVDEAFFRAITLLHSSRGKIIVTGIGKSSFIGMKASATLVSLGHAAIFLHPVEGLHGDSGAVTEGDVVVAFSYSGVSPEVVRFVSHLKRVFSISAIAVTGDGSSPLAQISDELITISVKSEGCPIGLAPMASTTTMLVVGDLIASALTRTEAFNRERFARIHPAGGLGLALTSVSKVMKSGGNMPLTQQDTRLSVALKEMTEKKLGVLGVVDKKRTLVGVITDGDLRRFLLKHSSIAGVRVYGVMNPDPKIVNVETSLKKALEIMEAHKITSLFVVTEHHCPVGVVHMHDIIESSQY